MKRRDVSNSAILAVPKLPTLGRVNLAITAFLSTQEPQVIDVVKPLIQLGS